jgi:hypothetical protein
MTCDLVSHLRTQQTQTATPKLPLHKTYFEIETNLIFIEFEVAKSKVAALVTPLNVVLVGATDFAESIDISDSIPARRLHKEAQPRGQTENDSIQVPVQKCKS